MKYRTPQRSYTPQVLELWFERMAGDWEAVFTEAELEWGRRFYRDHEVRSTELLPDSAIIHFKLGKDPLYVIIDWSDKGRGFRYSHPEISKGNGMAAAGLYEIEELIADEIPPVAPPKPAKQTTAERAATEERAIHGRPPDKPDGRSLSVSLEATGHGLRISAKWAEPNAPPAAPFIVKKLTLWEREQFIAFTALAHRSGCRPGDREGIYQITEWQRLEAFLKQYLPQWRRQFTVILDPTVRPWLQGLHRITPHIDLATGSNNGDADNDHDEDISGGDLRYRIAFSHQGSELPEALSQQLFRAPQQVHFVPGLGIFQVDMTAADVLMDWKASFFRSRQGRLPRYMAAALSDDGQLGVSLSAEVSAWKRQLSATGKLPAEDDLPDCLRGYQRAGVEWLQRVTSIGAHCLLADEMGLGKTLQILCFLNLNQTLARQPVLVVCPASVVPVWQAEIARFFPATPVRVLSKDSPLDAAAPPALWLGSYTQIRRNKGQLDSMEFAYAILDEAQNIKNPDAKVTHACLAIRSRCRIALTGTPMENRALDIWTLFRFLMPGFLGSRKRFEQNARQQGDFIPRLRTWIAPFVLRRTKQAVIEELPDKLEIPLICPLTDLQRQHYLTLVAAAKNDFAGPLQSHWQNQRMHLFSLLTRLRQVCCDPALLPGVRADTAHSGKLLSLINRLSEACSNGSKVVVFSQFVEFLKRARTAVSQALPAIPQFLLTGATTDRAKPVLKFTQSAGPAIFFVSLKAGGTGLNLQAADYVFLLDPWWNPAVEAQAIDRVHRFGQESRVIVYRLITQGTIEQRIEHLKQHKGELFAEIMDDMSAPSELLQRFENLESLIALEQ